MTLVRGQDRVTTVTATGGLEMTPVRVLFNKDTLGPCTVKKIATVIINYFARLRVAIYF